jgi:murein L,D-transpeptidase YcbB/YkuD
MKSFQILFIAIIFFSCNTRSDSNTAGTGADSSSVQVRTDTVYLVRNSGITPANSYSDLFLDSITVENFIQANQLPADEARYFRSFYNYRNGQFAWFTSLGFTEQAKGFWNLQDQLGSKADKSLHSKMDTLLNLDTLSVSRFDTSLAQTELALTKTYLRFFSANRSKTQFANLGPERAIPVRKENTLVLADSILQQKTDTAFVKMSSPYYSLRKQLELYSSVARQGGWAPINAGAKQIKKGSSSPAISLIKKRLQLTGQLGSTDTTSIFNDSLVVAITNYQFRHGMKPSGFITDNFIRSLNVPVETRIQQIITNLNRMLWMPVNAASDFISVNIPEFLLSVYENNTKVFDMPVAVGKEGTNTTMFSGTLDRIVFSPYWNIPASIVQREILPNMKSNPNYLKSRRMEIVGKNDSLPVIRQLPGKDNALGRVKFLFPNRFDIYFHDTYAKEIFNNGKRAVSHGCIRLADAEKLANYLLRNNSTWTPGKITEAMNSGKEQTAKPNPPMPVIITYYTAWVDETGQVNFRDDVYSNDKKIAQMMFTNTPLILIPASGDSLASRKAGSANKDTARKRR